jgi:outer membrane protein assembly factor BamA
MMRADRIAIVRLERLDRFVRFVVMSTIAATAMVMPQAIAFAQTSASSSTSGSTSEVTASTREESLIAQRRAKANVVKPYEPSRLERYAVRFENELLPRLLTPRSGFYARVGRVTTIRRELGDLAQGSGLAVGPGFRLRNLFGRPRAAFTISAASSISRAWIAEARLRLPEDLNARTFGDFYVRRTGLPSEDFFGLGPDSTEQDRVSYNFHQTTAGGVMGTRIHRLLAVGGGVEYMNPAIGPGKDDNHPSIEERFTDETAPALTGQPDFIRLISFVGFNNRGPENNPRRGGRYRLIYNRYLSLDSSVFDFTRTEVDVQHYLPAFHERRVLALHGFASFATTPPGGEVPFFMQRTIGGAGTLRGFREFRFRDRNVILLQAEYRFEIFTALDGALFYDAGQVAPNAEDFTWKRLETDWGFGLRFGSNAGVFIRVDLGFGREGPRPFLRFNHVF